MNSAIEQKANSITLSVSEQITQTKKYADEKASDAEANANNATDQKLTAYSTTTEMNSAIELVNDRIGLVITQTSNGDVINSASIIAAINDDSSSVKIDASKIELTSYVTTDEAYDVAYDAASVAAEDAIGGIVLSASNGSTSSKIKLTYAGTLIDSATVKFTGVVTFSDLEDSGATSINGDNIVTGTISADYIDTDNLSCTRLYADGEYDGWSVRLNGDWGDFGIYQSRADDTDGATSTTCMFGIYNESIGVQFYSYGTMFAEYYPANDTFYAFGKWNFEDATVTGISGGSGSNVAVFG